MDRPEFSGDVGQNVFGNIIEAPRLNNVVTLHLGAEKNDVELITDFQRRRINALVKDLSALTGDHPLDVYRIIITDFGLKKIKELPLERYSEVKNLLETWIKDAKSADVPADQGEPPSEIPVLPRPVVGGNADNACQVCEERAANIGKLQRTARVRLILLSMSLAACGWLLYKSPVSGESSTSSLDSKCYIAGKSYSIGHIEKSRGSVPVECVGATGDMPAMWLPANRGH
ncbi:hypothetical protein CLU90_5052 [Janthinobacterium sp. 67]|uniref:hypothetical protein n=1 Tax=Janthinobacterium sp. 67 TaxID=2035207 RepID=UPI000CB398E4|nr:hypothetical protein [Janthinobacterium sp. 67]PJJ21757.1 hypothetical protein CLU90_5052 [Janthinobacterium sp. 67]